MGVRVQNLEWFMGFGVQRVNRGSEVEGLRF